jgi:lipid II:glycine glycyltransferase (peptidoglycan interpeptide bridge formation enzyme)
LRVYHEEDVLATGLFPYDERCIYFWGAASWLRAQHLNPNELLHWHVIKYAVENGLKAYNMCGGHSQFKDKFGGSDVPYVHYSRSSLPGMQWAREYYRKLHYARLRR